MIEVLDAHQWRAYQGEDFPLGSWKDDNGILRADPAAARVDLISRQSYRNFSLTFEFSLAAGGNAGVLYRVAESWPESWQGGPEMQLLDNASHPDGESAHHPWRALSAIGTYRAHSDSARRIHERPTHRSRKPR